MAKRQGKSIIIDTDLHMKIMRSAAIINTPMIKLIHEVLHKECDNIIQGRRRGLPFTQLEKDDDNEYGNK